MNRTIKDATVKRFYYETYDELRTHLAGLASAYNFARLLKTRKGLHPTSTSARPGRKNRNDALAIHSSKSPGLNTQTRSFRRDVSPHSAICRQNKTRRPFRSRPFRRNLSQSVTS
jgi:hypothetical protein